MHIKNNKKNSRNEPNDSYVKPSNYFKDQINNTGSSSNCWTCTYLLTVTTNEYKTVYFREKHASPIQIEISVNPVIILFVKRQMDSAIKCCLKENSSLKVTLERKLSTQ